MIAGSVIVAALVWLSLCTPVHSADAISVIIEPNDSEIITTDLKRIRPAAPAEIRFKVTTNYIEQAFGNDLTKPRSYLKTAVISSARRVLSAMTGAQATGPDGASAVMNQVDRDVSELGVSVEEHSLRYVFLPGYVP